MNARLEDTRSTPRIPGLPLEVGGTPTADETQRCCLRRGTQREKETREWKMPTEGRTEAGGPVGELR